MNDKEILSQVYLEEYAQELAVKGNLKIILLAAGLCTIPVTLLLTVLTPDMFGSRILLFALLFFLLFLAGIGIAPYWPTL